MVINDLISNTIFSSGSMFFPGFTVSAFISGVIAGIFLYNQKISWQRVTIYVFTQLLVTNVFFTTLWLYLMSLSSSSTGRTFMALLAIRVPKEVIMWPIETIIILVILRQIAKIKPLISKN